MRKHTLLALSICLSVLVVTLFVGCDRAPDAAGVGPTAVTATGGAGTAATTANAEVRLSFQVDGMTGTEAHPSVRGTVGAPQVTVRMISVNVGNTASPTTRQTQTAQVASGTNVDFVFTVPAKTTVAQVSVENGTIAGRSEFHGAADLTVGSNTIVVNPVGSRLARDVVANVLLNIVNEPRLFASAPTNLAGAITQAIATVDRQSATAYLDAMSQVDRKVLGGTGILAGYGGGTIRGTVTPAVTTSVYMQLYNSNTPTVPLAATLIQAGTSFEFRTVPPGNYFLRLDPASGLALTAAAGVQNVTITNVEVQDRQNLTYSNSAPLIADHSLTGTTLTVTGSRFVVSPSPAVIRANGVPLPTANQANWASATIYADVASLAPGVYTISVANPDGVTAQSPKFLVTGGGTIRGSVTPAITTSVSMQLYDVNTPGVPFASTLVRAGTDFEFKGVPAGNYFLKLDPGSGLMLTVAAEIQNVTIGNGATEERQSLTYASVAPVVADHTVSGTMLVVTGQRFAVSPNPAVIKANGVPLPAANQGNWTSGTIYAGIASLAPGVYTISVTNPDGVTALSAKFLNHSLPGPVVTSTTVSTLGGIKVLEIAGANFDPRTEIYGDQRLIARYGLASWTSTAIAADLSSLDPGRYRLAVKNVDGMVASIPAPYLTFDNPLPPPVIVATQTRDTSVTLTWSPVRGATSYNVWVVTPALQYIGNTYSCNYTWTGLVASTAYTLGIVAAGDIITSARTDANVTTCPSGATFIDIYGDWPGQGFNAVNTMGIEVGAGRVYFRTSNATCAMTVYSLAKPVATTQVATATFHAPVQNAENFFVGAAYAYFPSAAGRSVTYYPVGLPIQMPNNVGKNLSGEFNAVCSAIAYCEDGNGNRYVYANDGGALSKLVKYDASFSCVASISLPTVNDSQQIKMRASADGSKLVAVFSRTSATQYGAYMVFNTADLSVRKSRTDVVPAPDWVSSMALSSQENALYMLSSAGTLPTLRRVDLTTFNPSLITSLPSGSKELLVDKLGRIWVVVADANAPRVDVYQRGVVARSFFLPSSIDGFSTSQMRLDRAYIGNDETTDQVVTAYLVAPGGIGGGTVKLMVMDASYEF